MLKTGPRASATTFGSSITFDRPVSPDGHTAKTKLLKLFRPEQRSAAEAALPAFDTVRNPARTNPPGQARRSRISGGDLIGFEQHRHRKAGLPRHPGVRRVSASDGPGFVVPSPAQNRNLWPRTAGNTSSGCGIADVPHHSISPGG
ncbi:MAG: hypothetical protein MZV70_03080 [Desulfobacterales bacterium]|nr:hypothetical protein [Desulfobacterales bacterium]